MDKCDVRGYFETDKGPLEISCASTVPHEVHYFTLVNDNPRLFQHKNVFDEKR